MMHAAQANQRPRIFEELHVVRTRAAMRVGEHRLPSGTIGAIVFVHTGGEAYEVEFTSPVATVVTLAAGEVEPAA